MPNSHKWWHLFSQWNTHSSSNSSDDTAPSYPTSSISSHLPLDPQHDHSNSSSSQPLLTTRSIWNGNTTITLNTSSPPSLPISSSSSSSSSSHSPRNDLNKQKLHKSFRFPSRTPLTSFHRSSSSSSSSLSASNLKKSMRMPSMPTSSSTTSSSGMLPSRMSSSLLSLDSTSSLSLEDPTSSTLVAPMSSTSLSTASSSSPSSSLISTLPYSATDTASKPTPIISSSSSTQRRIYINTPVPEHDQSIRFPTNGVQSTKYTIFSFLPKNLWEQFRDVANFFFLVIVILQFIPELQVGNPFFGAVPFVFILSASAVKDAVEDFRRYLEDRDFNSKCTLALSNWKNVNFTFIPVWQRSLISFTRFLKPILKWLKPTLETKSSSSSSSSLPFANPAVPCWAPKPWQSIQVGDIVFLNNNDCIPADILVLSTSEPDHVCYVETQSLDGETNLKLKKATLLTHSLTTPATCSSFEAMVHVDPPHPSLSHFHGVLFTSEAKTMLSLNHLILRGCILRNTAWMIGLVVYTGQDTKLVLNSGSTPSKRTQIDEKLNPHVIINFLILFTMSLISTFTYLIYIYAFNFEGAMFNSVLDTSTWIIALLILFSFLLCIIVFQTLIPISLFVTIEVVKTIQAYFIYSDIELYDSERNLPCVVHSWNLADDLGQVEYIFSDKTGTLTKNEMIFHSCSIQGQMFGDPLLSLTTLDPISHQKKIQSFEQRLLQQVHLAFQYDTSNFNKSFADIHVLPYLLQSNSDVQFFFLTLALCHTVLSEKLTNQDTQCTQMNYKAQSPDEAALVAAAHHVGITFLSRSQRSMVIDVLGQCMEFQVLEVFEFDSHRKRMSVIVIHPLHPAKVLVLCKGADSVIFERLHSNQTSLMQTTLHHLQSFSNQGLRTLCFGYRYLELSWFLAWHQKYQHWMAHASDHPDRSNVIETLVNDIETEFTLLGATAIEDKLQAQVPETIQALLEAKLKIWVLTGDKVETAISIGYSCQLLNQSMTLIVIQGDAFDEIKQQLEEAFLTLLQRSDISTVACPPAATATSTSSSSFNAFLVSLASNLKNKKQPKKKVKKPPCSKPAKNDGISTAHVILESEYEMNTMSYLKTTDGNPEGHSQMGNYTFHIPLNTFESGVDLKDPDTGEKDNGDESETGISDEGNEKDHVLKFEDMDQFESDPMFSTPSNSLPRTKEFALVIDGAALKHALGPDLKLLFLEVGCRCTSVMCCRVSPKQKAEVVALVKKELNCLTLSIGDGANDVSMLYEANIGVGIAGVEGCQAALASDFAITQFQHLRRLLFVHGRWNYRRIGLMCLLFFYKNAAFVFTMFWFQFYSGFSSSPLFEYSYITYYNGLLTLIPTPFLGIFDQDISAYMALKYPSFYSEGPVHKYYNNILFGMYLMNALYQSIVVFFITLRMFDDCIVYPNGLSHGTIEIGTIMTAHLVFVTNVFTFFHVKSWVWVTFVVFFLTFFIFPLFLYISSLFSTSLLIEMPAMVLNRPTLWCSLPLILVCGLAPHILFTYWRTHFSLYSLDHALHALHQREQMSRHEAPSRTAWMLESVVSSLQETVLSVVDFTKRGLRRSSKPFQSSSPSITVPSSMLMYMGSKHQSQRNTGFAFSADPGLPSEIKVTRDSSSDSNIELYGPGHSSTSFSLSSLHSSPDSSSMSGPFQRKIRIGKHQRKSTI